MNKLFLFLSILIIIILIYFLLIRINDHFSTQTSIAFFSKNNCNKCDDFYKNTWRKMVFNDKYLDIFFNRYDYNDNYNLAQRYGVSSDLPALVLTSPIIKIYKKENNGIDGNFSENDIVKWINKYANRDSNKINWIFVNRPS